MPRVLVTDAGRGSAVAVIRSLGRLGWTVAAADVDPRAPGLHSRYTSQKMIYPDPLEDANATARAFARYIERHEIDLVIPVTDEAILPLQSIRAELPDRVKLAMASDAALAVAGDKIATLELAQRLGVRVPESVIIRTGDVDRAARLGWPVVVKPARSRLLTPAGRITRHVVSYAGSVDELSAAAAAAGAPALAQEYVAGVGHGVELLLREGELVAAFQHRRIREVPITGGASSCRESVPLDPDLLEQALVLLRSLEWTGVAMVEFRVGANGSRRMEVNGRIWGSLPLAVRAGVDFPALLAAVHLDRETPPLRQSGYRLGVRSRSLPLEVSWIGAVLAGRQGVPGIPIPPRRSAVKVALQAFIPAGWDVLSIDDPRPGLIEIARVAGQAARRVGRRTQDGA